jgi:hypothetical protein
MRRVIIAAAVVLAAAASAWIFVGADAASYSASDTLYRAAVPIALVWAVAAAVLVTAARTMRGR